MEKLPLNQDLETKKVLKQVISANKELAKLNGIMSIIPNQEILINALILQEAKDSSEIENIITTHDEIYLSNVDENISKEVKEVKNYKEALLYGFNQIKTNKLLLLKDIIKINEIVTNTSAGIRKQPGTTLKNQFGKVIYTPPQSYDEIMELISNLEKYINDDLDDMDYLVKLAIIHYQFEKIHPFYDGNGRTGRIINVLYLVLKKLLDIPILYLSKYIIKHKSEYYKLLQEVESGEWENWVLFMLKAVEVISKETIQLIIKISELMEDTKHKIQTKLPKIYSKDLIDILFLHPYTKIDFLANTLNLHRDTASKYLKELEKIEILKSVKFGRNKYFVNIELFNLLKEGAKIYISFI